MNKFNLYQIRPDDTLSHITSLSADNYLDAVKECVNVWTSGKQVILTADQTAQIRFLEDNLIEWELSADGELMALAKMSTFAGDDCSEWLSATDVIEQMTEYNLYFKSRS
jgi:hypothetical protein